MDETFEAFLFFFSTNQALKPGSQGKLKGTVLKMMKEEKGVKGEVQERKCILHETVIVTAGCKRKKTQKK